MNNNVLTEQQQQYLTQLEEAAFLLPLLAAALRTGGAFAIKKALPKVVKWAAKNPVKAATTGYVATHPEEVKQGIETAKQTYDVAKQTYDTVTDTASDTVGEIKEIANKAGKTLNFDVMQTLASVVVKYGLPLAAVAAVIYGGKKLYDYMRQRNQGSDLVVQEYVKKLTFKQFLAEESYNLDSPKKRKVNRIRNQRLHY